MEVEETGNSCFSEAVEEHQVGHQSLKKCGSNSSLTASSSGCFDCNICLDFAVEPVVTLCGHLYCWPCIYKWLQQVESASPPQQCPVCKASLSQSALVPLYGRGHSIKPSHMSPEDIPRRPPSAYRDLPDSELESLRMNMDRNTDLHPPIIHHRQQHFHLDRPYYGYPYGDHMSPPASPLRSPTGTSMIHSSAGVLGGMAIGVLPWMFRNQEASMYYNSTSGGSGLSPPRLRRQEMQVERSLHQIWVFCCFCALLCLLLF